MAAGSPPLEAFSTLQPSPNGSASPPPNSPPSSPTSPASTPRAWASSKHKAHLQLVAHSQLEDRSGIILTNRAHPTSSRSYLLLRLAHLPSPTPARRSGRSRRI